jgi:hypothetical protein
MFLYRMRRMRALIHWSIAKYAEVSASLLLASSDDMEATTMALARTVILVATVAYASIVWLPEPASAQFVTPEVDVFPRNAPKPLEMKPDLGVKETPQTKGLDFDLSHKAAAAPSALSDTTQSQILFTEPAGSCPLLFQTFAIHHYRLTYQRQYLNILANQQSPLHDDVCECRLLPGDPSECVHQFLSSHAVVDTGPVANDDRNGGIEVFVTDVDEFQNLLAYVFTTVPASPEPPITPNLKGGDAGNAPPPGGNGPPPISPQQRPPQPAKAERTNSNKCERSEKICISPKDHKISAEFTVKCDHLPEFTFSTEGEASMKLGPITVSLSAP